MPTRNTLADNAKKTSIDILGAVLADGIDLALGIKQAHWSIRGPRFIAIHEMLDGFRSEIDGPVDAMAERIAQIRGTVAGTIQATASSSRLTPYPIDIHAEFGSPMGTCRPLRELATSVRSGIDQTGAAGDAVSADTPYWHSASA